MYGIIKAQFGLRAAWDISRVQPTKAEEGSSSIEGRINKGRVVINSVRHVVERELAVEAHEADY